MKNAKKTKLIETFNNMEAAGKLPIFTSDEYEVSEMDLTTPFDLNDTDMNMIRIVDVAMTMSNCVRTINLAKKSVAAAFQGETSLHNPIMRRLEVGLTEVLAAQADAMREIQKRAKAYTKAAKKRKATVQRYEKTESKTKVVG